MNENNLYFCRTPLQSLIINRLLHDSSEGSVVIYSPISDSEKHHYYFDKINSRNKYFINYNNFKYSSTINEVLIWRKIPSKIRNAKYKNLHIASVGSLAFSLIAGRKINRNSRIITFDDGTFNISESIFESWIACESLPPKIIKYILNGLTNREIRHLSKKHYTIFPERLVVGFSCPIEKIDVFENSEAIWNPDEGSERVVHVVLGDNFYQSELNDEVLMANCAKIIMSNNVDLYIPHPSCAELPRISTKLSMLCSQIDFKKMIAEDIIFALLKLGCKPIVYGFNSTALYNLSPFGQTINCVINSRGIEIPRLFTEEFKMQIYRI